MFRKCLTSLVQSTVSTGRLTPKAKEFIRRSVHNGTIGRPPKILITGGCCFHKVYLKVKHTSFSFMKNEK